MIRFFGDNRPLVLFFLPLVILGFHLAYHISITPSGPMDLDFGWWGNSTIKQGRTFLSYEFYAGLWVAINAMLLSFTFNSGEFNDKITYLPALIFVMLSALTKGFFQFDGVHLSTTMLILSFYQFNQLNQNQDGAARVFNAGFFLGIASSVYPPLILMLPFGVLYYLTYRPFTFREFLLYSIGASTPFIYLISHTIFFDLEWPTFHFDLNDYIRHFQLEEGINTAIFLTLYVIGLIGIWVKLSVGGNRQKKELQLVNNYGIGILISLIFCAFISVPPLKIELFIFPLSILFTYPLLSKSLNFSASLIFYILFFFGLFKYFLLN